MKMIAMLVSVISLSVGLAFAETAAKEGAHTMTKEQREKMATHHESMAACLRSEKSMKECHEEMHKSCGEHMGKDACPMMGEKGMHGHQHKMSAPKEEKPAPKK